VAAGGGSGVIPISDDNPARLAPVVTVTIILLCLLAFL
jgi:hypothetical protein